MSTVGRKKASGGPKKKKPPIFALRLRQARKLRGLSQGQLAGLTKLQQPVVSFYEVGSRRPSFSNLRKLADALEVTTDYLIGRSATPGVVPGTDEEILASYERLRLDDRRLVRTMISQLVQRGGA